MTKKACLIMVLAALPLLVFAQSPQQRTTQDSQQAARVADWAGFNRYAGANKEGRVCGRIFSRNTIS